MRKSKGLFAIIIGSVIVGSFLMGFLLQKRQEYMDKKECFRQHESFNGAGYTRKLPAGVDCTPYKIELDATFPTHF